MCSLCHQCFWPSGASFWVISHANTFTFLENKELASKLKAKLVQLYQSYMRKSDTKQNKTCPEQQVQTEYRVVEIWNKSGSRFSDLHSLQWSLVLAFSPGWCLSLCCWENYAVSWSSGRKFFVKSGTVQTMGSQWGIREKHSLWCVASKRGTIAGLDNVFDMSLGASNSARWERTSRVKGKASEAPATPILCSFICPAF